MRTNTYGLALVIFFIGVISAPLWAEVVPAPEHPANISAPAALAEDHKSAATVHKNLEEHHKAMAEQHKSLAKEHGKAGHKSIQMHHEELAKHLEAIANENAKTAATHESMSAPKN